MKNRKIPSILLACAVFIALTVSAVKITMAQSALGQDGHAFITWEADNYAPTQFRGKVLPGVNSKISASLLIIKQGRVADLSGQTIHWYLNSRLIKSGRGLQNISFIPPSEFPELLELSVQIPDYPGGFFIKETEINVIYPEIVIESIYQNNEFSENSIELKAFPYFFSINNTLSINYKWKINGNSPKTEENSPNLKININPDAKPGSAISVSVSVENLNKNESATKSIILTFKP